MSVILNMPRDVTLKFSGAFFTQEQIEHPKTGKTVTNDLAPFTGKEIRLSRGINTVPDYVGLDPRVQRFIVDPKSAEAQPKEPQAPAVPTGQDHVALTQQKANKTE